MIPNSRFVFPPSSVRFDHSSQTEAPIQNSQRHLSFRGEIKSRLISRIVGRCHVLTSAEFFARKDFKNGNLFGVHPHLWRVDAEDLRQYSIGPSTTPHLTDDLLNHCLVCLKRFNDFDAPHRRMRHMDVFSGAGGFTQGFARIGAVDVVAAIDISAAACETFKYVTSGLP